MKIPDSNHVLSTRFADDIFILKISLSIDVLTLHTKDMQLQSFFAL